MSEDNPYVGNECPNPEVLSGFVSGTLPANGCQARLHRGRHLSGDPSRYLRGVLFHDQMNVSFPPPSRSRLSTCCFGNGCGCSGDASVLLNARTGGSNDDNICGHPRVE
jgi:hypothetical protein